ncbi:heterokaryon incompatibility protein-domain-containing protein [Sphaerosporella brunnea]|uniref:Heterokaryon incompatibility protein-domain-containing protein n=1 Tax=Sphaerosporella brunnea TaxID=1250544 RepID=A0A5J5F1K2_9PEZI|nr:heterokaryon incompatibility protein-domain-containing protein [Sphaerosporella brunnea]
MKRLLSACGFVPETGSCNDTSLSEHDHEDDNESEISDDEIGASGKLSQLIVSTKRLLGLPLAGERKAIPPLRPIPSYALSGERVLCDVCEALEITRAKFVIQPGDDDAEFAAIRELGFLDEIINKPKCPLCRLVLAACGGHRLQAAAPSGVRVKVQLFWGLDGLTTASSEVPQVRCLGIVTHIERAEGSATLGMLTNDRAHIVLMGNDAPGPLKLFLGRPLQQEQIDFRLVKRWIQMCETWHGSECEEPVVPLRHDPTEMAWFRLIDVCRQCLVRAPKKCKYLALSYVWGRVDSLNTVKKNVQAFEKRGGLARVRDRIPKTIADAMELTQRLGMRYLWVDSLCIVQDDLDTKTEAIAAMDLVYGGAFLTVVAATGDNANAGLPGVGPNSRGVQQVIEEVAAELRLSAPPHWSDTLDRSVYDSRAWTYQERFFSKRCLLFLDGQIVFKCRDTAWREDIVMEDESIIASHHSSGKRISGAPDIDPIGAYVGTLWEYSGRSLTYHSDIFNAFAGLSRCLGPELESDWCFGLPEVVFDWALLWDARDGKAQRRSGAPSWSWAGWVGRVQLATFGLGTLEKVGTWLSTHTWIIWYHRNIDSTDCRLLFTAPETASSSTTNLYGGPALNQQRFPFLNCTRTKPTLRILKEPPKYIDPLSSVPATGFLQFWTVSATFYISAGKEARGTARGYCYCDILDRNGLLAGKIFVPADWYSKNAPGEHELLLLSEGKDLALKEEGYNAVVEAAKYEDEQDVGEWNIYNVMLTQWCGEWAERVAIGGLYRRALKQALSPGPQWKEIVLA